MFRVQGQPEIVELLESANARIEQTDDDNYNGGTYTYILQLDIPVPVFAGVEPRLQEIEKAISSKLVLISQNMSNIYLNCVTIAPLTSKSTSVGPKAKPTSADVKHIWKEGFFRLFLSHVSVHKVAIAKLKSELQLRGLSAFVAHEDIAPSSNWQNEIELALSSMHALAAFLTPDFHSSNWTDQEVGFALGKSVFVVPVRLGADPYGFISKVQGLSGSLDQPDRIASLPSNTLLYHSSTHRLMSKGLASAFVVADSYANAIALSKVISTITDFTEDEKIMIQRACKDNNQVFNAIGVVSRVCSALMMSEPTKVTESDEVPF